MFTKIRLLATLSILSLSLLAQSSSSLGVSISTDISEKKTEFVADTQVDSLERLNRIAEIEKHLDSERERIANLGLAPDAFRDEIYEALAEFTNAELKILLDGDITKFENSSVRDRAQSLLNRVAQFSVAHETFQRQLDQMTLLELDYFIEGTMEAIETLNQSLDENKAITPKALMTKNRLLALAKSEYQRYMRYHLEIGDPRDGPNRTDAYRSFFVAASDYFEFANNVSTPTTLRTFWAGLRNKTHTIFNLLTTAVRIAPGIIKVGLLAKKRAATVVEGSPVISTGEEVFRKIGRMTGHTVKIEGAQFLPPNGKPDGKTVYIIAPTHRDPIRDGIIMSNLGMSNYLLAMATDQMMPKTWADIFTENDNIVTVGRGSGVPITKILTELKRGLTDKVMIYPEGSVSAGLYETRPVREKFSWGLIDTLLKEGYDVKVIPLTYLNSGQFAHRNTIAGFFKYAGSNNDRELAVKISQPIDSTTLKLLAKATKSTAIGSFLRATWLQDLPHNRDFTNGLMRVTAVAKEIKDEFGISLIPNSLQCKSFYKK